MTADVEAMPPQVQLQTASLEALESIVDRGLGTFVEVGLALQRIRDGELYRERGYDRFEDYASDRFDIQRAHAYRTIAAAQVVENVSNWRQLPPPKNEAQARELAQVPAEEQPQVWERALEMAPPGKVTAKHVSHAAAEAGARKPKGRGPGEFHYLKAADSLRDATEEVVRRRAQAWPAKHRCLIPDLVRGVAESLATEFGDAPGRGGDSAEKEAEGEPIPAALSMHRLRFELRQLAELAADAKAWGDDPESTRVDLKLRTTALVSMLDEAQEEAEIDAFAARDIDEEERCPDCGDAIERIERTVETDDGDEDVMMVECVSCKMRQPAAIWDALQAEGPIQPRPIGDEGDEGARGVIAHRAPQRTDEEEDAIAERRRFEAEENARHHFTGDLLEEWRSEHGRTPTERELVPLIRADLKEAKRTGAIPRSVRASVSRSSKAITIRVSEAPFQKQSEEGQALTHTLEGILRRWNYDRSDRFSDVIDVLFFGSVEWRASQGGAP